MLVPRPDGARADHAGADHARADLAVTVLTMLVHISWDPEGPPTTYGDEDARAVLSLNFRNLITQAGTLEVRFTTRGDEDARTLEDFALWNF